MSNKILIRRSSVPGKTPSVEQLEAAELAVNTADGKLFYGTGTQVIEVARVEEVLAKSGGTLAGNLGFSKTAGRGILIEDKYGWSSIEGDISPKISDAYAAEFLPFIGAKNSGYAHNVISRGDVQFHMPHNYAPGTDVYLSLHWGHNGMQIEGDFRIKFWSNWAGREADTVHTIPITSVLEMSNLTTQSVPRYKHNVNELKLSTLGGGVDKFNTAILSVDGLLSIHYEIETIPSIQGSSISNLPYVFALALKMQSTGLGTASRKPNFYNF